jgi:hypothetical protein
MAYHQLLNSMRLDFTYKNVRITPNETRIASAKQPLTNEECRLTIEEFVGECRWRAPCNVLWRNFQFRFFGEKIPDRARHDLVGCAP